jgi:hypothetical protein
MVASVVVRSFCKVSVGAMEGVRGSSKTARPDYNLALERFQGFLESFQDPEDGTNAYMNQLVRLSSPLRVLMLVSKESLIVRVRLSSLMPPMFMT